MEQRSIPVKLSTRDLFRAMSKRSGLTYDELLLEMLVQFDPDEHQLAGQGQPESVNTVVNEQEIPEFLLEDIDVDAMDDNQTLVTT